MAEGFSLRNYRALTYGEKIEIYEKMREQHSYRGPNGDDYDYSGELFEIEFPLADFLEELHLTDKPFPEKPILEAPEEPEFVRITREQFEQDLRIERENLGKSFWPNTLEGEAKIQDTEQDSDSEPKTKMPKMGENAKQGEVKQETMDTAKQPEATKGRRRSSRARRRNKRKN